MTNFTLSATVPVPYAEALPRVRELLGDAGFGVLTEIDLSATLRAKLGVDVPQQVILGACMPQLAHRALSADPRIATMLPCNVVVADEGEETRVEIFDPAAMTSFSSDAGVAEVAADARRRLGGMLEALTGKKDDDAARA
ncbi:Uncharacterized conserved protein, DUF302 family [Nocardioides sp. YR527]|uniref:DUF302 domain-containing protein n=1 Tax=Nocardioides sp. YR527 TaxID=1881028 RepID=UPI00088C9A2E|nr:DUF302 domain-containing protein [Nocardioides sp. YR527]SDL08668.1 Uncharacterized conserved protein, DUF302 family [Nocardioides sp. YR527]